MTNQQDLRERIAEVILHVNGNDCTLQEAKTHEPKTYQWCMDVSTAILALISPPDPGLASVLEDALELLSDSAKLPPKDPAYHDVVKRLGSEIGFGAMMSCATLAWRERLAEQGYTEGGEHTVGHTRIVVERLIERIRAALTSGGWQSIDSAPKDGTKVLCWTPEQSVCLYWCKHRGGWFEWADNEFCMFPTHWMPLPEPPTSKPDTGE